MPLSVGPGENTGKKCLAEAGLTFLDDYEDSILDHLKQVFELSPFNPHLVASYMRSVLMRYIDYDDEAERLIFTETFLEDIKDIVLRHRMLLVTASDELKREIIHEKAKYLFVHFKTTVKVAQCSQVKEPERMAAARVTIMDLVRDGLMDLDEWEEQQRAIEEATRIELPDEDDQDSDSKKKKGKK